MDSSGLQSTSVIDNLGINWLWKKWTGVQWSPVESIWNMGGTVKTSKKGSSCVWHILSPGNLFFCFFFYLLTLFYNQHETTTSQAWPNKENKIKWPKRCWHWHLLGCRLFYFILLFPTFNHFHSFMLLEKCMLSTFTTFEYVSSSWSLIFLLFVLLATFGYSSQGFSMYTLKNKLA